jgi:hypothetical protein
MNIPNKITLSRIIIVGLMLIALFVLDIVYWPNPSPGSLSWEFGDQRDRFRDLHRLHFGRPDRQT